MAASELRKIIQAQFHPFVESRGFRKERPASATFTEFRRVVGDRLQVFDVQWDKYQRPRFVLNFGESPAADLLLHGRVVPLAQIGPPECPLQGRLQRRRGGSLGCWFGTRKPLARALLTASLHYPPQEVLVSLTTAFQELEEWWLTKQVGPHIQILR